MVGGGVSDNIVKAKEDYLKGMKYKDLAEKYGVKIDTVKSWVKRHGWAKEKREGAHKGKKGAPKNKGTTKEVIHIEEPMLTNGLEELENSELDDRQRLFCIYYVERFNATKAYKKAYGCGYTTARTNGCRLLTKTNVQKEINRLKTTKLKGAMFDLDDLIQKHIDIALADMTDFATFGTRQRIVNAKDVLNGEEPIYDDFSYVDAHESDEVDGSLISEVSLGQYGIKIKLVDKKQSLNFLEKFTGFIDPVIKKRLDMEREKLEILKAKEDKGEGNEGGGVVILPEVKPLEDDDDE